MNSQNEETDKSTGTYPYGPLAVCLPIAEAVKSLGGSNSPVSKASLASFLKEDERGSRLATKIASAKAFGMIEGRSDFKLTGSAILYFSSTGQQHRSALLDFLQSPAAFKKLIERFDGTLLPPDGALVTMLNDDSLVPKSWQERVAGFFVRSAKFAGVIDSAGHLRVKASRESRVEDKPKVVENGAVNAQIRPPEFGKGKLEISSQGAAPRFNAAAHIFTMSDPDEETGQNTVYFAELPVKLTLSKWQIFEKWLQSIKPEGAP